MCNLYSITKSQAAIIALARAMRDTTGNLEPRPAVFPDWTAPIVRNTPDGARELTLARWGMPSPPRYGTRPITNVRNTQSAHWRQWLKPENRCLVPWTSFSEYDDGDKKPRWFAFDTTRPLALFAGIWCKWNGTRGTKADPVEGEHTLFGFLTTEPNDVVRPVHAKAMPVILTEPADIEIWMTAPAKDALSLQRPLPDGLLKVVARGLKEDDATAPI